ncbi:polysaccharide biosynthesis C-terminal domain-containing protein [Oribacterium sp. P6A1]|uniref:polysaccharide biosynthesis C-terminal domain-containing protein n=1 Tax=Oribacterium sp. P6A1 TaxID=1410612 RepID=UPI00056A1986|nr:polysaccharide biosynthesis C-terminal domain-containing protein [Oribacterium sp. P6A1]
MMESKFRKTSFVAITAVINNLLMMLYGLIYNKLVIVHYGSSTTGLIATLSQFAAMFTIIEGGFTLAVVVATYKPIINEDYDELNAILYTAKTYFNKITVIYASIVMISGGMYVYYLKSPIGFVHSLVLLGLTTFTTALSIGGTAKYTVVLSGNNRQYITSIISLLVKTITWIISLVMVINDISIILVYSINVLNVILNILALKVYEKKKYPFITYRGNYNLDKINGVKDIMFQKIASTIFTSTDLVLVSLGLSLSKASVYYVYNQIFQGVFSYLSSFGNAPIDSFGHLISSGNNENAKYIFEIYKKTINLMSTIFFSTAAIMIIPFLKIYTRDVKDENYIIPSLATVFFTYNYLKLNNLPYGMIINVSGEFKKQNIQTGIAAVLNIGLSIILMRFIGLNGIITGSAIGTLIIIVVNVIKAKEVLAFDLKKDIVILIFNYMLALFMIINSIYFVSISANNYFIWLLKSIVILIAVLLIVVVCNIFIDRVEMLTCIRFYLAKLENHRKKK